MSKNDARDPYGSICLSRLTRILDLKMLEDLQELENSGNVAKNLELERHFKPHRSFLEKSTEKFNKIIHRKHHHHIFGHPLTNESVERILPLIHYLKTCVDKEGLFRISGNKKRQEELKELIDRGDTPKLGCGKFTAHDVASVLKQFLGELPEPLLTQAPYRAYLQVTEISNDQGNAKHVEALQLLFLMIPPENRSLLHNLLELLKLVLENPNNKMTAYNLAVVFCPNVLYCNKQSSFRMSLRIPFRRVKSWCLIRSQQALEQRGSCISSFPQELDALNESVAFMITFAKQLFQIPDELKKELKLIEKNISIGKEDEVPMAHAYCHQLDNREHRETTQQATTEALVELYNHVKDMPDGPMKQKFMEKFEKTHPGTPPFMPRSRARTKPVDQAMKPSLLTYSTPIKSTCTPGSLARPPLSPINANNTMDQTSHHKNVTFRSPDVPAHRPSHSRSVAAKASYTPSGVMSPFKSPHRSGGKVFPRHKRTLSAGNSSMSPFRRSRTRTAHAPSVPALTIQTPSGRMVCSPDPYNQPGAKIRKLYGSPAAKKRLSSRDYQRVEETFV
ncbi:rho GTPase-activating protein 19 isoform X1 [Nematostella vectensis]|uniref:rho GTPase-activating protein 19 isoform X1 n=2 Tax=Nematostella vectensis TaxID=45351 RepID=UPI00207771C4|nr:rho GTPase-activating protein 19 isoform X1 [Nematostella vectensis]